MIRTIGSLSRLDAHGSGILQLGNAEAHGYSPPGEAIRSDGPRFSSNSLPHLPHPKHYSECMAKAADEVDVCPLSLST